jgi:hypothetical protein
MTTWCRRVMPDKSVIPVDEKSATIQRAIESFLVPLVVSKSPGSARSDSGYRGPSLAGGARPEARFGVGQVRSRDFARTRGHHRSSSARRPSRDGPELAGFMAMTSNGGLQSGIRPARIDACGPCRSKKRAAVDHVLQVAVPGRDPKPVTRTRAGRRGDCWHCSCSEVKRLVRRVKEAVSWRLSNNR